MKYTAFCKQSNDLGTVWIEAIEAHNVPDAKLVAQKTCAEAWGWDIADVSCIGLAIGDITIVHWEDLSE
jgi:hypothetical protein